MLKAEILIAANIIFFFLSLMLPGTANMALNPEMVFNGHVYQFITSMFLHDGLNHILLNMLALFFFGTILENTVGRIKFTLIYFLGGITGGIFFVLFAYFPLSIIPGLGVPPHSSAVGASGAIFAVGAALAIIRPQIKLGFLFLPVGSTILFWLIFWFMLMTIYTMFGGHIANSAHLGGLLSGFLMGWFIKNRLKQIKILFP